jgi:hypothetical protein
MATTAEQLVDAIATKDAAALHDLLAEVVSFKGLTPRRFWEADDPAGVVEIFGQWFEPSDHVERVVSIEVGEDVAGMHRVGYRLELSNEDGPQVVEQQAYFSEQGGRIDYLRIVCSGFRPR